MRRRLPLWAFIVLAVICLIMLGIACACAMGHPPQKVDQPLGAAHVASEPLVEVWTFAFGALVMLVAVEVRRRRADDEISPAALQRFLF
jgi:putative copper export protein